MGAAQFPKTFRRCQRGAGTARPQPRKRGSGLIFNIMKLYLWQIARLILGILGIVTMPIWWPCVFIYALCCGVTRRRAFIRRYRKT